MGIRQDYHYARGRRPRSRWPFGLRLAAVAALILTLALGITALLERDAGGGEAIATRPSGVVEGILAPLPMQGGGSARYTYGPQRQQEGAYTLLGWDAATIRQPACGQVELGYFSDAVFLGDSLTEGFTEYSVNLGGALVCGYIGIGPDTVVNRSTVQHPERGSEVVLEAIAAAQPQKVYILLGTNTLTTAGMEERFVNYYSAMLDEVRAVVGEQCVIYVQSIPPVAASVQQQRPGLASGNLRQVNEQLAQLAAQKGCVYLDLWEALADEEGNLSSQYSAPDGVHLSAGSGYPAWVGYLRTHARYAADNEWVPGSAYAAG